MSEWQPIESAPKDGKPFFATGLNGGGAQPGRHYCVAEWLNDEWFDIAHGHPLSYLTHWMPIPEIPK